MSQINDFETITLKQLPCFKSSPLPQVLVIIERTDPPSAFDVKQVVGFRLIKTPAAEAPTSIGLAVLSGMSGAVGAAVDAPFGGVGRGVVSGGAAVSSAWEERGVARAFRAPEEDTVAEGGYSEMRQAEVQVALPR